MSSSRPPARRRRTTSTVIAAALGAWLLAPGCGARPAAETERAAQPIDLTGPTTQPGSERESGANDRPAGDAIASAVIAPFELDRTVWFTGFKISLTTGTVDPRDSSLTIEGEAQNEGSSEQSLSGDVRLEQDRVAIADGTIRTTSTVLAGGRNAVEVKIPELPATFDPAQAVLVMGDARHQQVRLPLRGQGEAVTGEPEVQAKPSPIRAGTLTVTVDEVSVRHDNPQNHEQAPAHRAYVVFEGSVRFDGPTTNVQSENFSLLPPNGAAQSPDYVNALPGQGSSEDIYATFEMPTPIGGAYTLHIRGDFLPTESGVVLGYEASGDTVLTLAVDQTGAGKPEGSQDPSGS